MNLHIFNIDGLLERKEYYGHLTFAYGTFDLDTFSDECIEIVKWCKENCLEKYDIFDTFASYIGQGVMDVTVIGFVDKADAMAFKLRWT